MVILFRFVFVLLTFLCGHNFGFARVVSVKNSSSEPEILTKETFDGSTPLTFGRVLRKEFLLDPNFVQLNHGAFGTYPRSVQTEIHKCQARSEANADRWIRRDAQKTLAIVRNELAELVNAEAEDIVVVPNTTSGVNAILRSMIFKAGDVIMHFSTVFSSVKSTIQYVEDVSSGNVTSAEFRIVYPEHNDIIIRRFEAFINSIPKVRLAIIDHITSTPAVLNPIDKFIPILKKRGIPFLIDGAHAIGHVPIDLKAIKPDYYITSVHKWLFAARSTAMLYVDKKHQGTVHPPIIASDYRVPADYQEEFFWTGTIDYCNYATVPAAMKFRRRLGGEDPIRKYNHALAVQGGLVVAQKLGTRVLQFEDQIGNMVDVQLPIRNPNRLTTDFWTNALLDRTNVFVTTYKHGGNWWGRFSAQVYTDISDFAHAGDVLRLLCDDINAGKL